MAFRTSLKDPVREAILRSIKKLADNYISLNQVTITHDEYLRAFVAGEHWDLFRRAPQLCETPYNKRFYMRLAGVRVVVRLEGDDAPMAPKYPVILYDAPPDIVKKFTGWVEQRIEDGWEWGRVVALVDHLSNRCSSPAQIKFYLPSLLTLLKLDDDTKDLAVTLQGKSSSGFIPSIKPECRAMCRRAASLITAASLIEEPQPWDSPVTIGLEDPPTSRNDSFWGNIKFY